MHEGRERERERERERKTKWLGFEEDEATSVSSLTMRKEIGP